MGPTTRQRTSSPPRNLRQLCRKLLKFRANLQPPQKLLPEHRLDRQKGQDLDHEITAKWRHSRWAEVSTGFDLYHRLCALLQFPGQFWPGGFWRWSFAFADVHAVSWRPFSSRTAESVHKSALREGWQFFARFSETFSWRWPEIWPKQSTVSWISRLEIRYQLIRHIKWRSLHQNCDRRWKNLAA